jgi:dTDP-4-amino-4,6-dideoxygalactose transaminase
MIGGNFRIDAIQAAVLNVKFKYLDEWTRRRGENASFYGNVFGDAGLSNQVTTPKALWKHTGDIHYHVYNQFVIRAVRRDELQSFLREKGIGTEVYYPVCLHIQECFRNLGYRASSFPEAERASGEALALPIYPELGEEQLRYVVASIAEFFAQDR